MIWWSASLLGANPLYLGEAMDLAEQAGADAHHVDVMDGHFVPNLSFGLHHLPWMCRASTLPLDVHLMIKNPQTTGFFYLKELRPKDRLTIHGEGMSFQNLTLFMNKIREKGCLAGLALSPHDSLRKEILCLADFLLLMSVEPGKGGQSFLPDTYQRLELVKSLSSKPIVLDGGITLNLVKKLHQFVHGFVLGTSFFQSPSPLDVGQAMRQFDAS